LWPMPFSPNSRVSRLNLRIHQPQTREAYEMKILTQQSQIKRATKLPFGRFPNVAANYPSEYARSISAISILTIPIIACITRPAFDGSGSDNRSIKTVGVTCHESPNLS